MATRLQHTALFALSLNVRVTDAAGREAGAIIAPVLYVWLWIPGWLWGWWTAAPEVARLTGRPRQNRRCQPWALLFGPGWRDDLRVIGLAAWLLLRDWRLANGAPI